MENFVVLDGNPRDGFMVWGPFPTEDAAFDFKFRTTETEGEVEDCMVVVRCKKEGE